MSKNIVICSDGTGNTAGKERGTNVFKLYEAVELNGAKRQVAIYDEGVGTQRMKVVKLVSGAFGWGLSRKVKELYAELARVYESGDNLFLFGFSRGAFTVRTLAGLIADRGIVTGFSSDRELRRGVRRAYKQYRYRYRTDLEERVRWMVTKIVSLVKSILAGPPDEAETARAPRDAVPIRFIGVWDTVDAVGLPIDWLAQLLNAVVYRYKFPNYSLGSNVQQACHALAIDDERHTFHPRMWDEHSERTNRIEQVWFAGAHSNVGGGYPSQGMSQVPLAWMMARAEAAGLQLMATDREMYQDHQSVFDKLYDSRAGLAVAYRYQPRDIYDFCTCNGTKPKVHASVVTRIANGTAGYAPGNLPGAMELVDTESAEVSPESDELARRIYAYMGTEASLLEKVRGRVLARRSAHFALWCCVALGVYITAAANIESVTAKAAPGLAGIVSQSAAILALFSSVGGWVQLGQEALIRPWLPTLLAAFYLAGVVAENSMKDVFSMSWHRIFNR